MHTLESRKDAARRFVVEALDGGNAEVLQELFLPGAVRHFPPGDIVVGSTPPLSGPRDRTLHNELQVLLQIGVVKQS
jgi:hypothetical protein